NVRNDLEAYYMQVCDINISKYSTGTGWEPIGTSNNPFYGEYNGCGYEIQGLKIDNPTANNQGLFGYVTYKEDDDYYYEKVGTIKNVVLKNANVIGKNNVGAIIGCNYGIIRNSGSEEGNIEGTNFVGGVAGEIFNYDYYFEIDNLYSSGKVKGVKYVGGIAGEGSEFRNLVTTADIEGVDYVGGIAGSGYDIYGGLVLSKEIKVTSGTSSNVGAISGSNLYNHESSKVINTAKYYPAGASQGTTAFPKTQGIVINETTAYSKETYDSLGWELNDINATTHLPVIRKVINLKILFNEEGTSEDPIIIDSVEKLKLISNDIMGSHYKQTTDLDLKSESNWLAIGSRSQPFKGLYDGNGHTINNLTINNPNANYQGLFGVVKKATIKNIGLSNVNIKANNYIGGMVGYAMSQTNIENSYVSGDIKGSSYVGGIMGQEYGTDKYSDTISKIKNCYVIVNLTATTTGTYQRCGGIIGFARLSVENCYSIATINATRMIGSIAGTSTGYIIDTVAINTSIALDGSNAAKKTNSSIISTAQAKLQSTYTNRGWDFTNTWKMSTSSDYPVLKWEKE
ncbi:MAG: GLUG motif-containing protein, partial [Clostridia bacterium]|nr:GLUG motif-containing protein [Clostridia bacterium]